MAKTNTSIRMHKRTQDLERMRKANGDAKADAQKDAAISRGMRRLAKMILAAA